MKRFLLLSYLLFTTITTAQVKKGKLIWEENFEGKALNESVWNYELGNGCPDVCGWGNNERQDYTKTNHEIKGGNLIITVNKNGEHYTSTRITTAGKKEFKYGYIEARAKLPVGQGIWPAFWMLGSNIGKAGWPLSGEIDILEYVGKEPDMVYTTLHTQANHGEHASSKKTEFKDIEEGYHLYAINWTKDQITFYVDGTAVYTFAPKDKATEVWPFNQPFFFIVNVAVGGNFGGPEVDDTIFPQQYFVDYIKVYEN